MDRSRLRDLNTKADYTLGCSKLHLLRVASDPFLEVVVTLATRRVISLSQLRKNSEQSRTLAQFDHSTVILARVALPSRKQGGRDDA